MKQENTGQIIFDKQGKAMNNKKIILILLIIFSRSTFSSVLDCDQPNSSQAIFECSKNMATTAKRHLNKSYHNLAVRIKTQYASDLPLERKLIAQVNISRQLWWKLVLSDCAVETFFIEIGTQAYETTLNYCVTKRTLDRSSYIDTLNN